jgi:hypothetical protein
MVRFLTFVSSLAGLLLIMGFSVTGLSFANPGVWEWSPSGLELSPSLLLLSPRAFLVPPEQRLALKPGLALKNSEIFVDFQSDSIRQTTSAMGIEIEPPVSSSIQRYSYLVSRDMFTTLWKREAKRGIRDVSEAGRKGGLFSIDLPIEFPKAVQAVVGRGKPNLRVTGSETIAFNGNSNWTVGQKYSEYGRQSKFPRLDMKQDLVVKMGGTIGDKIDVDWDQSSAARTELQNRIRIRYHGYDDEVIQSVDLGNTNLSIPNTQYVSYSGMHEGLFGIKSVAKLGNVDLTVIASKQEGKQDKQRIVGGARTVQKQISDLDYKKRTYFFLDPPSIGKPLTAIDLENIQVFIDDQNGYNNIATGAVACTAYVYKPDGTKDTTYFGHFNKKILDEDYRIENIYQNLFQYLPVLVINGGLPPNYVLAVTYRKADGSWVGNPGTGPDLRGLELKMIAPPANEYGTDIPTGPWASLSPYELKNIYYLGSEAIIKESFMLTIKRRVGGSGTDQDALDSIPYIQITGLDQIDRAGKSKPDGLIDESFIDLDKGVLIFPDLHPFAPDSFDLYGWQLLGREWASWNRSVTLTDDAANPVIYSRKNPIPSDSRYYLDVQYKSPQTTFYLGWNVLENSEVVTLNGVRLQRGTGYVIDYDTGELTLLTPEALEAGADVSVDFSRASMFGLSKSLLGISGQYKPTDELSLATTWLYESKGTLEERPRLDQEPSRTIVGGLSGTIKLTPSFMTSLVDALPLVESREKSSLAVSGEFGISIPNPNTRNEVYIDDMEGNKETRPFSLLRSQWRASSLPEDPSLVVQPTGKRALWWYNLHPTFHKNVSHEGDLYPERAPEERDRAITALEFYFNQTQGWHGLTQVLSWLGEDFTEMQYIEMWVKDCPGEQDKCTQQRALAEALSKEIKIDLGTVSEDAMWDPFSLPNEKLDTEDRNRNGALDLGEDTGLDGKCDPAPKEGCTSEEGPETCAPSFTCDQNDPGGDDYDYQPDKPYRPGEFGGPYDFSKINGTEGNGKASPNPTSDTEDLNGDGTLDTRQDYFEFTVGLAQGSKYQVRDNGNGWRLFRIPLSDTTVVRVGQPRWDNVKHVRLWFKNLVEGDTLRIGSIEVVGNRWIITPIADSVSFREGERFYVGVINNKENGDIYQPPPIQIGEENGIRKREQSLVLSTKNLFPPDTVSAYRPFAGGNDYTQYESLKFWLRGSSDSLVYFIRFGTDTLNFYEYATPVPAVWESREFRLADLSALKVGLGASVIDTTLRRSDGGWLRVRGQPSFTRVQRITMGLINITERTDSTMISSDSVWVDELRLTDVKKDIGTARRVFVEAKFADFLSLSTQLETRGEDFLAIGSTRGSGRRTSSYQVSGVMAVHKFLPTGMFNVPLNFSLSESKEIPKFMTGADIVLKKGSEEAQTTKSGTRSVGVSFRKTPTPNKWLRYTVEAVGLGFGITDAHSSNVSRVDSTRTLSGSFSYQFSPAGRAAIDIPMGHGRKLSFSYLPSSFSFTGRGVRTQSKSYERSPDDPMRLILRSDILRKTGDFGIQTSYSPLSNLRCNYDISTTRDWLLFNPSKALGNINIGTEVSRAQNFRSEFTPRFGSWLTPNVSFAGSYREDHRPELKRLDDVADVRNVANSGSINLGLGIPISRLAQLLSQKPAVKDTARAKTGVGGEVLTLAGLLGRIGDVRANHSISYGSQLSRIYGKPDLSYMFGIRRAPRGNARFARDGVMTSSIAHTTSMSTSGRLFRGFSLDARFETTDRETEGLTGIRVEKRLLWPELRLGCSELERYLGMGGRIRQIRLDSAFRRTTEESGAKGKPSEKEITKSDWTPLVTLSATWKGGMSTSFTSNLSTTETKSQIGAAYTSTSTSSDHTFNMQKTIDATKGFSLPFAAGRKIRLKSSVNVGLSVQYSTTSSSVPPLLAEKKDDLSVTSNANYSFSANLSGGFNFGFTQDRDLQIGVTRRSLRLGLSASFRF